MTPSPIELPSIQEVKAHVPSRFQAAVNLFITDGIGNAVINAVAGSGKTTTIVNALTLIPTTLRVLFLAFNRDIVRELKKKAGHLRNVEIKTLHGFGKSAIDKAFPKSMLDKDKYRRLLSDIYFHLQGQPRVMDKYEFDEVIMAELRRFEIEIPTDAEGKPESFDVRSYCQRILRLTDLGRFYLATTTEQMESIAKKHSVETVNGECYRALMLMQLGASFTRLYDFGDMLYFPVIHHLPVETYTWVFVDEGQDMSIVQRTLMQMAVDPVFGRFVAVGDPRQAIYGFAGADVNSFQALCDLPNTIQLPLSICYRCPQVVVDYIREFDPSIPIEARDNAPEGELLQSVSFTEIVDNDMVLCRNTMPLVKLYFEFLRRKMKASIKGKEIGAGLISMIENTNREVVSEVFDALYAELEKVRNKIVRKQGLTEMEAEEEEAYLLYKEKIEIIELLSEGTTVAGDIIRTLQEIFSDEEKAGIQLSTIHRSKGLEAERVFILHRDLMPSKYAKTPQDKLQESNLIYVAYSRAKNFLGFISDFDAYGDKSHSRADSVKPLVESEFQGAIGGKVAVELTITEMNERPSNYGDGTNTLFRMKDAKGNVFSKWGVIGERFLAPDHDEVKVGAVVRVNGTVKDHKTYKGIKETVLSHLAAW